MTPILRPCLLLLLAAACAGTGPGPAAPAARTRVFDGMRLHYLDAGAGELPVVLVHGFGGSAAVWRRNLRDLAAFARVLAVDLPGHGGSEAPEEPQTDDPIPVPVLAHYARSPFWDEAYEAHVRALCLDLAPLMPRFGFRARNGPL